jgi:hypothetical protein
VLGAADAVGHRDIDTPVGGFHGLLHPDPVDGGGSALQRRPVEQRRIGIRHRRVEEAHSQRAVAVLQRRQVLPNLLLRAVQAAVEHHHGRCEPRDRQHQCQQPGRQDTNNAGGLHDSTLPGGVGELRGRYVSAPAGADRPGPVGAALTQDRALSRRARKSRTAGRRCGFSGAAQPAECFPPAAVAPPRVLPRAAPPSAMPPPVTPPAAAPAGVPPPSLLRLENPEEVLDPSPWALAISSARSWLASSSGPHRALGVPG